MIAILLTVLGTIGKILLFLLKILPMLAALALFFPVFYRADIKKEEEKFSVRVSVSWLFRVVYALVELEKYGEKTNSGLDIRIVGIPVLELLKKRKKKKAGKNSSDGSERPVRTEATKKPTVPPGSKAQTSDGSQLLPPEVVQAKHPNLVIRLSARIAAVIGKIRNVFRKIAHGTGVLLDWLKYLSSKSFSRAMKVLLHEGGALLRHVLPRKIAGDVRFGTDDPAKTGMILGVIGVLYPVIPEKLCIEPDFTESIIEMDLTCKGHLILFVVLVRVIRILICKDVRVLIGRIWRELKAGSKKKDSKTVRKGRGKSWRKTKKTMDFRTT